MVVVVVVAELRCYASSTIESRSHEHQLPLAICALPDKTIPVIMTDAGSMPVGFEGQSDPQYLSYPKQQAPKHKQLSQAEWERKQRLREYRVASRREKRNRKADEKKQRKLNATILRRMTRNPDKYTKNAGRNRDRAVMLERRKIQWSAVKAVQRLAAVHDPSGKKFNVAPVALQEDGTIVTQEALERKKIAQARREAIARGEEPPPGPTKIDEKPAATGSHHVNANRAKLLESGSTKSGMSKRQQKKLAKFEPKPEPPRPVLPDGLDFPSDEEEHWLSMWDLPDEELLKRAQREKKRAARNRKELRLKQQSGKAERRAARDEKRKVYKTLKETWKTLREEERKRRRVLQAQEDEEGRRLAIALHKKHREDAMEAAAELGFTFDNVPGVADIKPKVLGMKGVEVNWDDLEIVGESSAGLRAKSSGPPKSQFHKSRIDLSAAASESAVRPIFGDDNSTSEPKDPLTNDFLSLNDFTSGANAETHEHVGPLNLNNRNRRKLRRALNAATLQKELLVRQAAIAHCKTNSLPIPATLQTPTRLTNTRGSLTLPSGVLETSKQERVRARVELAEFNRYAKILRRQAKEKAIEAGIRVYLELTDRIPRDVTLREEGMVGRGHEDVEGMMSAADWIAEWPMPGVEEGRFGTYDDDADDMYDFSRAPGTTAAGKEGSSDSESGSGSGDSASRQLMGEMRNSVERGKASKKKNMRSGPDSASSSADDSDSDEADSDDESASEPDSDSSEEDSDDEDIEMED